MGRTNQSLLTGSIMKGSTIVLATDLSDNARCAAKWAHAVAQAQDGSVVVTHVVSISVSQWARGGYDVLEDSAMMQKAEKKVVDWYSESTGEAPDSVRVMVGHPAVQIAELVEKLDAEMLVLSSSGKGAVEKFLVGSTAQSVSNDPPCPLVIVEPEHTKMHDPARIVVGTDYSTNANKALDFAASLARAADAKLHIVHAGTTPLIDVVDISDLPAQYVDGGHYEWARDEMAKLLEAHNDELQGVDYDAHVLEDAPAKGLLGFAEKKDADMIIIGRSGHSNFVASVMGSVVLKVLHSMSTTTIIVPTD
jgi:nucleotide-binding universal stress UspA family protein